jgi:hypothetical protein
MTDNHPLPDFTITSKTPSGKFICHPHTQPNITYHVSISAYMALYVFSNYFYLETKVSIIQHFRNISFPLGFVPVFIGCPSIIEHRLFPPFVQLRRRNEKL